MALRLISRAFIGLFLGVICTFGYVALTPEETNIWGDPPQVDEYYGGWQDRPESRLKIFRGWAIPQEWKAGGQGRTRLLYQDYEKVHGHPLQPRAQGKSPSCVGQAVAQAVDVLAAVEINAGQFERPPPAPSDAGIIYGLSRQEIGDAGFSGGSHNEWACEAIQKYGVVFQLDYPLLGIDLREFDAARAIQYGRDGCPDALEPVARLHVVRDYIQITSWDDLRDAIYYGCPVVVGSPQGFGAKSGAKRDADGFLSPPRRLFRKSVWRHSMLIIGMSDEGREGVLFINSWGPNWISGPKRFGDEPEGSFWVDRAIVEGMIAKGDTYAIRDFEGYPSYQLWSN